MRILPSNPAGAVADWSDVESLQRQLYMLADEMGRLSHDVGLAKHVDQYDGDRRRRALARAMAAPLAGGASAAAAEAEARSGESYSKEMAQLGKEHASALQVVQNYDAVRIKWETARSLLSMMKEQVRQL